MRWVGKPGGDCCHDFCMAREGALLTFKCSRQFNQTRRITRQYRRRDSACYDVIWLAVDVRLSAAEGSYRKSYGGPPFPRSLLSWPAAHFLPRPTPLQQPAALVFKWRHCSKGFYSFKVLNYGIRSKNESKILCFRLQPGFCYNQMEANLFIN